MFPHSERQQLSRFPQGGPVAEFAAFAHAKLWDTLILRSFPMPGCSFLVRSVVVCVFASLPLLAEQILFATIGAIIVIIIGRVLFR